jgi:hypothetical protein
VGGMSFLSLFSNPFLLGSAKSLISMGAPFHVNKYKISCEQIIIQKFI